MASQYSILRQYAPYAVSYTHLVRVLLGADEEYIVKTFANLEVEDQSWEGWTDDYGGRCV